MRILLGIAQPLPLCHQTQHITEIAKCVHRFQVTNIIIGFTICRLDRGDLMQTFFTLELLTAFQTTFHSTTFFVDPLVTLSTKDKVLSNPFTTNPTRPLSTRLPTQSRFSANHHYLCFAHIHS